MPGGSRRWVAVVFGAVWGLAANVGAVRGAPPLKPVPPLAPAAPEAPQPPVPSQPATPELFPAALTKPATEPPSALPPLAPAKPESSSALGTPPSPRTSPLPPLPAESDPPVKDLTPPGFADLVPAADHRHERPGHLTPTVPADGGPFATAEFLLLRPRRGAFDFAIPSTSANLATTGPVQSLNYNIQGGLRAQLGYRFGDSGWDALGEYTYFRSNASGSGSAGSGYVFLPTLTRPGLTNSVSFAAADGNLEYNLYDVQLGRRFAVDDHLALRAFGGLRFASIRQDFHAYYDGLDARQASVSVPSNFQGFGPIVGTEATFAGWKGFHLYARASGGLLTGQSNNPILETNNAGQTVYVNSSYDVRKVVPVASVGVGGGWQYRSVSIRVGYEITNWFNLIDQPRFADDVAQGVLVTRSANLSLEGLFVQFGLTF